MCCTEFGRGEEIGEVMKAKERTLEREKEREKEVQQQSESLSLIECFVVMEISHTAKLAVHNSWVQTERRVNVM